MLVGSENLQIRRQLEVLNGI